MIKLDEAENLLKGAYLNSVLMDMEKANRKEKRKNPGNVEIVSRGSVPYRVENVKPGRNEQCPCGSGKKYKKCCLLKGEIANAEEDIKN